MASDVDGEGPWDPRSRRALPISPQPGPQIIAGSDEQVVKAQRAVDGNGAVKRNRFIKLTGATTAVNIRLLEKSLIPGLTVHQAKGGEWPRVGVYLTEAEAALLSSGLEELRDDDCVLYVAITRAMTRCGRLSAQATLFDSPVSE